MKNILVTGASGQLGCEIKDLESDYKIYFKSKLELDITDSYGLESFIKDKNIFVVINLAAYTNVDQAENDIDLTYLINLDSVIKLAEICRDRKGILIHISTDYVFDGKGTDPYTETCACSPLSVYGRSKYGAENAILSIMNRGAIIIRTSWLYSIYGDNFVKKIIELSNAKDQISVINDQIGSPTYAKDLAIFILELINFIGYEKSQIYHFSNNGEVSWFDFSKEILRLINSETEVIPIKTEAFNQIALRPKYSVLDTSKYEFDFFTKSKPWRVSLQKMIKRYLK
jgi:dTDP-4-dehydrorhamnose reductase